MSNDRKSLVGPLQSEAGSTNGKDIAIDFRVNDLAIDIKKNGFFVDDREQSIAMADTSVKQIDMTGDRVQQIDITNRDRYVDFLNKESYGMNTKFLGSLGSILNSENANISQSSGLVEGITGIALDGEDEIGLNGENSEEYVQTTINYAKYIDEYTTTELALNDIATLSIDNIKIPMITSITSTAKNVYVPNIPHIMSWRIAKVGAKYYLGVYGQLPIIMTKSYKDSLAKYFGTWSGSSNTGLSIKEITKSITYSESSVDLREVTLKQYHLSVVISNYGGSNLMGESFKLRYRYLSGNDTTEHTIDFIDRTETYVNNGIECKTATINFRRAQSSSSQTETIVEVKIVHNSGGNETILTPMFKNKYYYEPISKSLGVIGVPNGKDFFLGVQHFGVDITSKSATVTGSNPSVFNAIKIDFMTMDGSWGNQTNRISTRYISSNETIDNESVYRTMIGTINNSNSLLNSNDGSLIAYSDSLYCNAAAINGSYSSVIKIRSKTFTSQQDSSGQVSGYSIATVDPSMQFANTILMHTNPKEFSTIARVLQVSPLVDVCMFKSSNTFYIGFVNNYEQIDSLKYVIPTGSNIFGIDSTIDFINVIHSNEKDVAITYSVDGNTYYMFEKSVSLYTTSAITDIAQYEQNYLSKAFSIQNTSKTSSMLTNLANTDTERVSVLSYNADIVVKTNRGALVPKGPSINILMSSDFPMDTSMLSTDENESFAYPCTVFPLLLPKNTATATTAFASVGSSFTLTGYEKVFEMMSIRPSNNLDYGIEIIGSIPSRDTNGNYNVLPSRIRDVFNISYDLSLLKPCKYPAIVGRTEVCVDNNIYAKSKLSLIPSSFTPMIPEDGEISIYSGFIFVNNANSCTIYTVTELGFQYVTSIPSRLISNVVSISGVLVFYANDGIWGFDQQSGLRKLVNEDLADSDTAVIKSLDGYPFLAMRSADGNDEFYCIDGQFEASNGDFTTINMRLYAYEIGNDLSIGKLEEDFDSVIKFTKTNSMDNENALGFDASMRLFRVTRDTSLDSNAMATIGYRVTQFFSDETSGFNCNSMLIILKSDTQLTNKSITVYIDDESNTMTQTIKAGMNRIVMPITRELTENMISLSFPVECDLVGVKLRGNFIKHTED